jgi:hypothetical protein
VAKEYYEYCLKQMPAGAIKADLRKYAPHNWSSPAMGYVDQNHTGVECVQDFTLAAREQRRGFEVLKIPIHVSANRCPAYRRKRDGRIAARKQHMEDMAKHPRHPEREFFGKKS